MSNAASLRFSCNACQKSYAFKPELANKKVKCKCGAVVLVPDLSASAEEDTYDFAEETKPAIPVAKPVRKTTVTTARSTAAPTSPSRGKPPVLGYKSGPSAAQRQRADSALIDMKRDIYIPASLIAGSFLILVGAVMSGVVRGDPMATSIAFTLFSLINAVLMIGGALFIGGKVGISFGDVWTAILKFVAIAFFVGMITTIIDEKFGMLGMAVLSIAASAVLYTILFIYLFNMDMEDSVWMVCFFIGLRTALSWLLLPILIGFFASGGAALIPTSRPPATAAQMQLAEQVDEWKELGLMEEAAEYVKTGKQTYWTDGINAAYTAGAKYVGFAVARDINGKATVQSLIVEMPDDPTKRAAIVKAINDFRTATHNPELGTPPVLVDTGGQYLEVP